MSIGRACVSCCGGESETMQTVDCTECQCKVFPSDVERELGQGALPADHVLGHVEDTGEEFVIEVNGTYLAENVSIIVGACVEW